MGQAPDPICVGHVHARPKASRGQRDGRWYWEARWQAGEGERPSRALGWLTRSATCSAEGPPSTVSEAGALERWERRA